MAKVKEINLHVVPMYGQVQFSGMETSIPNGEMRGLLFLALRPRFLGCLMLRHVLCLFTSMTSMKRSQMFSMSP